MPAMIDRFELARYEGGRVSKGWRVTRYTFGHCTMQHLRTGASKTGVIDCFGNIQSVDSYMISEYSRDNETLVEFYAFPFNNPSLA